MKNYSKIYLKKRPLFLALIRSKEAELFREYLPFRKPVLDFGCGDGFFAQVAFGKQGKIDVGIDVDGKPLKEAREKDIYQKVIKYDGGRLPFPDGSFNTVVSNCVLEHVVNLESNLLEISRVLKSTGRFICSVMADKWEGYLAGKVFFGSLYERWMRKKQVHHNLYSYKKWKSVFEKGGFTVINTVGYIDRRTSTLMDVLHYISAPSLISHRLFGKWVLFPDKYELMPVDRLLDGLTGENVGVEEAAALFFVLEKS